MADRYIRGVLQLQDESRFVGQHFGCLTPATGEVVFNTGMVGYTEALTDPSYRGQILVLTYPLIGNYGVADPTRSTVEFESGRIQVSGLIVSEICREPNHWNALQTLSHWLESEGVPGLASLDTRALTKRLRTHGTMMGSIGIGEAAVPVPPASDFDLVSEVTVSRPMTYSKGEKKVILIDCGCKESIVRNLLDRNITVQRVPYDYDFLEEDFHAVLISNGPGDPKQCRTTVAHLQTAMKRDVPIFGICLGNQLLALAAGADTFKLKFGHRGHNQPCLDLKTGRCYITSQNHGYAVKNETLPGGWEPWFVNANDGTNEGIRHVSKPFMGVQFHPEACPGPLDTTHLFDEFLQLV